MNTKWVRPNTIVGDAATGNRYIRREYINEELWHEVKKGNHILFVAPRRVGKTSIMKDVVDNCPEGYYCLYEDIESVPSKNMFYKRLAEMILKCSDKKSNFKSIVKQWWDSFQIKEISTSGVSLEGKEINYEEQIKRIIPELKAHGIHVVLFIDEFAEVIYKLYKNGYAKDAVDILHTIRELRHDEKFRHFTLVFAGSIGLHHVVQAIDRPKIINDLHRIEVGVLNHEETIQLIKQLTIGATIQYNETQLNYLLQKVDYLLPYYIQLMLEEIDFLAQKAQNATINEELIDRAFDSVANNSANFDDWLRRLRDYQTEHFPFINHLLKYIAHNNQITIQEVYNIANDLKYNRQEDYMDFVDQLSRDGYLVEYEQHKYRFLSPFLKSFWLRKYPIFP